MDIHKILDDKIKSASKKDRSKINRILVMLKGDTIVLRNNFSQHLYVLYKKFYEQKLDDELKNYDDPSLITYLKNKCITSLREIKQMKSGH